MSNNLKMNLLLLLHALLLCGLSWGFQDLRSRATYSSRVQLRLTGASKVSTIADKKELGMFWKKVEAKVGRPGLLSLLLLNPFNLCRSD